MRYPEDFEVADGSALAPTRATHHVPVEIRPARAGRGVFALRSIPAGTAVFTDGGRVIHSPLELPAKFSMYQSLIAPDLFLSPRDYDNIEPIWFLNHHCESNLARFGGLVFVSRRAIDAGEELTLDYSTFLAGITIDWQMACSCTSCRCRRVITRHDWEKPAMAKNFYAEYLPFVQRQIVQRNLLSAC